MNRRAFGWLLLAASPCLVATVTLSLRPHVGVIFPLSPTESEFALLAAGSLLAGTGSALGGYYVTGFDGWSPYPALNAFTGAVWGFASHPLLSALMLLIAGGQ